MVGMGIDGLDVKQRAGFCAERRGKFSLRRSLILGKYSSCQLTKTQPIPSKPSQLILPHPMHDFGWLGWGLMGLM
jgi:hypothetical protein